MAERDDGCRMYQHIDFQPKRLELIRWIRKTVDHYASQGMNVTVRQIYYKAVTEGLLPSGDGSYDRIQSALNKGRLAGLIPWHMVVDRGRSLRGLRTELDPHSALTRLRSGYRRDLWADQPYHPEVWVEKAALEGVIGDICSADDMRVDYYATRGYDSQSQQYEAGQRLAGYVQRGQRPVIFHLGDHDPSGVHMSRDLDRRIAMFVGVPVMVQRIALSIQQVRQYDLIPFEAKRRDSRTDGYIAEFGTTDCWELDALDPSMLRDLIRSSVGMIRDDKIWAASLDEEIEDHKALDDVVEDFAA
jgi:hypothetical protein